MTLPEAIEKIKKRRDKAWSMSTHEALAWVLEMLEQVKVEDARKPNDEIS